jgi:hypothetical protein
VRCEHLLQHTDRDPRFVAELRHPAGPRVQFGLRACIVGERVAPTVDIADAVAQRAVSGGDAELFDPGVLVRWNRL